MPATGPRATKGQVYPETVWTEDGVYHKIPGTRRQYSLPGTPRRAILWAPGMLLTRMDRPSQDEISAWNREVAKAAHEGKVSFPSANHRWPASAAQAAAASPAGPPAAPPRQPER